VFSSSTHTLFKQKLLSFPKKKKKKKILMENFFFPLSCSAKKNEKKKQFIVGSKFRTLAMGDDEK
jgi:hypothetical protein